MGGIVRVGDVVTMRKPHACGSFDWEIVRLGADIGIKCLKCGRKVLLDRSYFERRAKSIKPHDV
ncbi:MAG: DUF951 domain-containing protein [Armatimonadota bacterium]